MGSGPKTEVGMSLRAYATRRGTSVESVRRAIKRGRLRASVGVDGKGKPRVLDPDLADREWKANTDLTRRADADPERDTPAPADPERDAVEGAPPTLYPGMSMADAAAADKYWSARRRELEYKTRRGELIELEDVLREQVDAATAVKAKLRRIPDAIAEKLVTAAKRGPNHIKAILLNEIDQALRELAREGDDEVSAA